MLGELHAAARRGCRIVAFNPLRERGLERFTNPQSAAEMLTGASTAIASSYYQPRIGGDLAAVTAIAKRVVEVDAVDHAFVVQYTRGFERYAELLRATPWDTLLEASGLSRAELEEAARIYADSRATIFCWGMGITQHRRSVATIQSLMNLLLLRGNVGRPGAGPCPVRGHSNVQGDRTMGIHEKPGDAFLDRLGAEFGFAPPRADGHDVVGSIQAMLDRRARVFFAMGGNFATATPDTARVHEALRRCALTAHVTTKLNRSHLVHGRDALILPCLGRSEIDLQAGGPQAVTVEDSMSMVHLSAGMNPPASPQLLSEPAIVARLAAATLPHSRTPWLELIGDYDRIRERIARVVPGFEDFNRRVRAPGGFHLHHPARERVFPTRDGKAHFFAHPVEATTASIDPAGAPESRPWPLPRESAPLLLTTLRSHDQYNTTIYGLDDRYRGVRGYRRVCFISRTDLERFGFAAGERVDIVSQWHDGERVARDFLLVEYDIPAGCVASYFPETNTLVPLDSYAERARTPTSKSIPVRLVRR
jgi:molybdopterin-dependent oxidoreductase alpha subunit